MVFPVHQHEVHDELVPIDAGVVLLFRPEGNQFFRYRAHLVVVGIHAFVIQHELVRDAVPVFGAVSMFTPSHMAVRWDAEPLPPT